MKVIYAALVGIVIAVPVHATERTVKTESLACNPERQFDRAERFRISRNTKALKAFTAGALLSRTCISLKPGATVFTEGVGKGAGIIKVRPKGAFKSFFTSELAFQ